MKRLDTSELIFKIVAYLVLILFALACVYPLIYVVSVSISGEYEVLLGKVKLLPRGIQFEAYKDAFKDKVFWMAYCNTIFYSFYGTIVSMVVAISGAYALSKSRLMFRRGFNFMLVFTMWFNAGLIPTYKNFVRFNIDNKYGYIFGLGFNAFNIVLLRNFFETIPTEIEEAATIDGATEFQLLTKIYMPMSKTSIVTVTMFYALSRWNGWFWAEWLLNTERDHPLQVYLRRQVQVMNDSDSNVNVEYASQTGTFALIICSILPIIILYPQMQKYFAAGVNVGGVKE
jgi:putative aldouronate transport system permease protein